MKNLREKIQRSTFRTQERFSVAAGIAESTLSKIIRGLRRPTKEQTEKIAATFRAAREPKKKEQ